MKRFFTTFFLATIASLGIVSAQAVIKFDKSSINLGTFSEDQPQTCVFEFTNTGDKPLVIEQAFSSCGCTVPNYTQDPIAPGARGKVTVTYNGKGKFAGHFTKPVSIRSNASNGLVKLMIEGTMTASKK